MDKTPTSVDLSTPGLSGTQQENSVKPSHSAPYDSPSKRVAQVPAQSGASTKATPSKSPPSWKRSASSSSIKSPHSKRSRALVVPSQDPSGPAVIQLCVTPDKRSPSKCQSPVTPSNQEPFLDLFQSADPSPFKSIRPKFLPKNVKQHRKKYEERQKYLDSIQKMEEKWAKCAPTDLELASTPEQGPVTFDPCGHTIPQISVFRPEKYFISFEEESLNVNNFVPPDSPLHSKSCRAIFVYLQSVSDYTPTVKECRFFFYWLTVTKKSHVVGFVLSLFHQRFHDRSLYLGWEDLQKLLINFGLTKEPPQRVGAVALKNCQTGPQPWNLECLLFLLENSYENYSSRLLSRLLNFLVGAFFEPLFSLFKSRIANLANKIIAQLNSNRIDETSILDCIDQHFCSICCNRYIFQMMSSDPALSEISKSFAVRIIEGTLKKNMGLGTKVSTKQTLNFLEKNKKTFEKLDFKYLCQVVIVAEKLLLMEKSESVRSDGAHRLFSLLQMVGQTRIHFERLYLDEIIRRVKAIV